MLYLDCTFIGIWLGILGRRSLHAIDDVMYRQRPAYREDEYNLSGLFDWEEEVVERYFQGRKRLLVTGAGGGREVLALAARGYEVEGYECNAALVESGARRLAARSLPQKASLSWVARDEAPPRGVPFDGVIVGWSAYMLIISRDPRVEFLTGLRDLIEDDAPLLVSFFTRSETSARLEAIARVANAVRRTLRRPPVEIGDSLSPNYVHHFTSAEIEEELRAGGFSMLEFRAQGMGPHDSGFAVGRAVPRKVHDAP